MHVLITAWPCVLMHAFTTALCVVVCASKQATRLPQLMVLELSGNQLTRIDENVGHMHMLKELDLSGNMLTQLHENLGTLPKLEVCAMGHGHRLCLCRQTSGCVQCLPLGLSPFPGGRAITERLHFPGFLRNNVAMPAYHAMPSDLVSRQLCLAAVFTAWSCITISNTTLSYTSPQVLELENNRLDVLPESIGDLPSLVKLDISTNSLRFLPSSMVGVGTCMRS